MSRKTVMPARSSATLCSALRNSTRTQSSPQGNRFVHLVVLPERFLCHLELLLLVSHGLQCQRVYHEIHRTAVFLVRVRCSGQAWRTVGCAGSKQQTGKHSEWRCFKAYPEPARIVPGTQFIVKSKVLSGIDFQINELAVAWPPPSLPRWSASHLLHRREVGWGILVCFVGLVQSHFTNRDKPGGVWV